MPDATPESLMELVKLVAEENGEPRDRLHGLSQVRDAWRYSPSPGAVVFDLQTQNVQYSSPYAAAVAFPALKADGRYYKLEEVKV